MPENSIGVTLSESEDCSSDDNNSDCSERNGKGERKEHDGLELYIHSGNLAGDNCIQDWKDKYSEHTLENIFRFNEIEILLQRLKTLHKISLLCFGPKNRNIIIKSKNNSVGAITSIASRVIEGRYADL